VRPRPRAGGAENPVKRWPASDKIARLSAGQG
jgi:hypothetical protein